MIDFARAAALVLAGVFGWAAVAKALAPTATTASFRGLGLPAPVPCTPLGIQRMLIEEKIETAGKFAVIIGRSNIVGTPVSILLAKNLEPGNCTVTLCHSRTQNLASITQTADILVAALGRPEFVTADMVKPGAVVIDVGMNRNDEGKLCGDVDFEGVKQVAGWITPVPGGVGPMTRAMLLVNTIQAAERSID